MSGANDLLAFTSCMLYGIEMAENGFAPFMGNISGTPAVCIHFSQYVQHIKNISEEFYPLQKGLMHLVAPHSVRWATVIIMVLSILIALV